jgi:hypothetical protein
MKLGWRLVANLAIRLPVFASYTNIWPVPPPDTYSRPSSTFSPVVLVRLSAPPLRNGWAAPPPTLPRKIVPSVVLLTKKLPVSDW